MLHVAAFVPYPVGRAPGQRYRIEQWAPGLTGQGIEVEFVPFLSVAGMDILYRPGHRLIKMRETLAGYKRRLQHLRRSTSYDAVFVYREAALLGPPLLERRLVRKGPLVFDFDDAIYLPTASPSSPWVRHLRPRGKTPAICGLARHVTVGNQTLATFARSHSREVSIVPSTIDTVEYVPGPPSRKALPVVGWTGSTTTIPYLRTLLEPLRQLRKRVRFRLRVIGGSMETSGLDTECVSWSAATEVADLRAIDIGVMPLPDDPWARGKCGLKALQYMALGIPPVVSPVGVNREIVLDGINGFHASTAEEWVDKLTLLLCRPDMRERLGAAARRTVEQRYSASVWVPRVGEILHEVADAGTPR